jgi:anti-sigma B factor antagonist
MSVKQRSVGEIVIVSPRGAFFGDRETDELEQALMGAGAAGNVRCIVNLAECESLNSVALGVLMRAYAYFKSRGGELKLCCLGKRLKDLFTMTKLIMVFDHHDTEEEAIAAFIPSST